MTRRAAVIAALAILAACASGQTQTSDSDSQSRRAVESNTSLGMEYMNRGQYEVALGKLKKAVREDPGYAPAHTVLGVLYERIGETELAGKHYRRAVELDPDDGDVNNNYGVFLCKSGDRDAAIRHLLKALDDPFYGSPKVALGNAGSCALGAGDLERADGYLRRALKEDPEFADALLSMARLNFERKNYLSARAFMQRYEAIAEHSAATLLLAYKIETASRDGKAASRYKLQLESNFPGSDQAAEVRRISGQ